MRSRSLLLAAAVFAFSATLALATRAQETAPDVSRLDTGARPAPKAAAKGKPQAGAPSAGAGKAENRQYGELEGWSPGKTPPKKEKKEESPSPRGGGAPVSMGSNGGMQVGMPF